MDKIECPVCHKLFKPTDNMKFKLAIGYTCSWKCFYKYVTERDKEKRESKNKS